MTEKMAALILANKKHKALHEQVDGAAYGVVGVARAIHDIHPSEPLSENLFSLLKMALDRLDAARAEEEAFTESEEYRQAHNINAALPTSAASPLKR